MKKYLLVVMLGLLGCKEKVPEYTMLMFVEQEKLVNPYQTRFIVSAGHIRIDDGSGAQSYILYDRKQKIIYSVSAEEERTMLVREKNSKVQPPFELKETVTKLDGMKDAPEIGGVSPQHYEIKVNDKTCYNVVAARGLMPHVVEAMKEFHSVLASDSRETFNNIPADMHDACDMSMLTFRPLAHLQFGFPIQEWGRSNQYQRSLVDYKTDFQPEQGWNTLPENYQMYSVDDLRQGKVQFAE